MDTVGKVILFFEIASALSIIAIILMFLLKEKGGLVLFYTLSVAGMMLAWFSIYLLEDLLVGNKLMAWIFGAMGAAGILVEICGKQGKKFWISRVLTMVSIFGGLIGLFVL